MYVHLRVNPTDISHIDCVFGSLCYIRTVFHLNCLTAQLSNEGRAAVEGAKYLLTCNTWEIILFGPDSPLVRMSALV
jgi:hypothetical protein